MGCCAAGGTSNFSEADAEALAKSSATKNKPKSEGSNGVGGAIETKQAKLADSNMANYGSDEHKALRKDASGKEKAWTEMERGVGLQIWRIEKFEVVPWPKAQYGQFHGGDSYIILHTQKDADTDKLIFDVFFWLGAETSQDEAGTAAYKTVELDDFLDDEPIQYREVQGNESKRFLDLFPTLTVLDGGIESGFRHVEAAAQIDKLLHITGYGKQIQAFQVAMSAQSLNNADAFILDRGELLFQFNGNKATKDEKWRATQIVNEIKSARGKCDLVLIDGLADKSDDARTFWSVIGCSDESPQIADGEGDGDGEGVMDIELVMSRVSNANGFMDVTEVQRGKALERANLDSMDCFIVDGGQSLFVWCGNRANKSEKRAAMTNAVEYLKLQGRERNVPISRQIEGRESEAFWKVFQGKEKGGGRRDMGRSWKSWFK